MAKVAVLTHPSLGWRRLDALPAWLTASREQLLVGGLMVVGLLAQGWNMFHSPALYRFGDEGIYAAQAWAVLREHKLSPYTYFYDHAPAGWILFALWMALTGGPFTFGSTSDSGRLFALLLHVAMVPLLYRLARKLGADPGPAAAGVLLFSLSPLAIFYQRLLLLDNIMLFWLLLSLDLLLDGWGRLSRVVLSGLTYGLACLTKETAIFLLPAMLFIAIRQRRQHQGHFGLAGWILPVGLTISWYPLFAALKGELLPAGEAFTFFLFNSSLGASSGAHVSLTDALRWQATRSGGGLLSLDNQFWQLARGSWLPADGVLVLGGAGAILANLARGWRDPRALAAGLLGLCPLLYLGRGGVVFDYYILFAIPFACLNLALVLQALARRLPAKAALAAPLLAMVAVTGGYWRAGLMQPLYDQHPDQASRDAVQWIKTNLPRASVIVINDDMWTDLHEAGLGGPDFPYALSHWKVASDPAIRDQFLRDEWSNVDYLVMSPGIEQYFQQTNNTIALQALAHSHEVIHWTSDGVDVQIMKVDKPGATETALLAGSDGYMAQRFEHDGAYVGADGTATSESQAYALLRAVWSDNPAQFGRVWQWTQAQLVNGEGLLSWQAKDGAVSDSHSAADADVDAALALLMAGRRWNEPAYLAEGQKLVDAIWQHDVTTIQGKPYLTAGDWASGGSPVDMNPSYFSPYALRVFQEADPSHDWQAVIDSGYDVLFKASSAELGADRSAGLPPDWVAMDRSTGQLLPVSLPQQQDTTGYGYDAARTYWRIALDLRWSGDGRAQAFLQQAGFLRDQLASAGQVGAAYQHDGTPLLKAPSVVGDGGAIAALLTLDPGTGAQLYDRQIVAGAHHAASAVTWADPSDLYSQEWGWFTTALYANALPNLWRQSTPTAIGGKP